MANPFNYLFKKLLIIFNMLRYCSEVDLFIAETIEWKYLTKSSLSKQPIFSSFKNGNK
jgi:hypothetical protein